MLRQDTLGKQTECTAYKGRAGEEGKERDHLLQQLCPLHNIGCLYNCHYIPAF